MRPDNLSGSTAHFEKSYLSLRQKEQRIYTDEQLLALPDVPELHPYHGEWHIRRKSAQKLISYLKNKQKPLKVLEIGCGNAWLAAKIAEIADTEVMGIDPNTEEINQGKRVFKKSNLNLLAMDFASADLSGVKFDVILFAASIQYFPSISNIIATAQNCLAKDGEIHILDTHLYGPTTAIAAGKRTADYFAGMGFAEMTAFYFHHQLDDLKGLNWKILYNPNRWLNRLINKNPFYWICIKPS